MFCFAFQHRFGNLSNSPGEEKDEESEGKGEGERHHIMFICHEAFVFVLFFLLSLPLDFYSNNEPQFYLSFFLHTLTHPKSNTLIQTHHNHTYGIILS